MLTKNSLVLILLLFSFGITKACSVIYFVDQETGKIYIANNEDYWYDVDAYIQLIPKSKHKYAHLWYGWDDFAQGGVNEHGLFFDGAVTPSQNGLKGFSKIKGNLGDDILAKCKTVDEALSLIRHRNIGLNNAHMMFGDRTGNAVVLEWVNGKEVITKLKNNKLIMTNFLLADTAQGNYPCPRYQAIDEELEKLQLNNEPATLKKVGTAAARGVQSPFTDKDGRTGGTLYSTFIDISDMKFILVPKLDNSKITQLDLKTEFEKSKKYKIKLE